MTTNLPRPTRESSASLEIPPRPIRDIAREAVADIDQSLQALRDWGVPVRDDSRLHKARVVLKHAAGAGILVPKHRGDRLGLRSLELALDYAAIADTLPAARVTTLRRDLRDSLVGGIEPPETARGPLQLQSQAVARAAFVRAGVDPLHPTHSRKQGLSSPDLVIENEGHRYAIEAKRPQWARNVLPRFTDGCEQVKKFGLPGGVLVDVTDALRDIPRADVDGEVRRLALMMYDIVFVSEQGHRPGYEHIHIAGAYTRLAWTSHDGEETSMVDVHTSSCIGIFAAAEEAPEARRAKWLRSRFEDGLERLNRTLAETRHSPGAA